MRLIYRPIELWPGQHTEHRRPSPFGTETTWPATLGLLETELRMLEVDEAVLQLDTVERNFRINGELRADAKPDSPSVILSFESAKYPDLGTITYPCDTFTGRYSNDQLKDWQVNVRAIALGLEALRKVERYGIANTGQQYTGWKALPAGIPLGAAPKMTKEKAAAYLAGVVDKPERWPAWKVLSEEGARTAVFRLVAMKLHPDKGGDPADWLRAQEAMEVLGL